MFAVTAILVGGAIVTRATISDAIWGGQYYFIPCLLCLQLHAKICWQMRRWGEFFRSFIAYSVIAMSLLLYAWQKYMSA